jgi:hypothetical protein
MTALAFNSIFYSIFNSQRAISRAPIKRAALEAAITAAVKSSNPSCEPFVGVIVELVAHQNSGKSRKEANWAVKGVKFGKAEREQCNSALSVIIERLKREFEIAD